MPVGCIFVREGNIIGRGMNDTNRSLNVCVLINAMERLAPTATLDQSQLLAVLISSAGDPTRRIFSHQ